MSRSRVLDAAMRPMTEASLDDVLALENAVYPFPWTRGNFVDALAAGYTAWTVRRDDDDALVAYCVALPGVAEMHLLNITVAPDAQRRGQARALLRELADACRRAGAERIWLEVRESNVGAREAYRRLGFVANGRRRGYYPAVGGREDAIVMSIEIEPAKEGTDALD